MNVIRSIAVFFVSAVMVVIGPQYGFAEIFNRVVAIVNDDVITLHELNQRISQLTSSTGDELRAQDEKRYLEMRRKILELMIDEKCAQEKIRDLQIIVSPREIDTAIENVKRNNQWTHEDLVAGLKAQGITYEEYREKIKTDLERHRLINAQVKAKIIIREEEITRYYEEHKGDFRTEETVRLEGIFLIQKDPKDAEEIRQLQMKGEDILARLKRGEDFGDLAKQFSQGPGAEQEGALGVFEAVQLDAEVKKAIDGIEVGEFTGLITRPNGVQIIKLIERQRGGLKPIEDVRDIIYETLYQEKIDTRYESWIRELRKEAYTKIVF